MLDILSLVLGGGAGLILGREESPLRRTIQEKPAVQALDYEGRYLRRVELVKSLYDESLSILKNTDIVLKAAGDPDNAGVMEEALDAVEKSHHKLQAYIAPLNEIYLEDSSIKDNADAMISGCSALARELLKARSSGSAGFDAAAMRKSMRAVFSEYKAGGSKLSEIEMLLWI